MRGIGSQKGKNKEVNPPLSKKSLDESFVFSEAVSIDTGRAIDKATKNELEKESDEAYREIARRVVDITEDALKKHEAAKSPLRDDFSLFVSFFLIAQFVVLVFILTLNNSLLHIDARVLEAYIVSVFAETLGGLFIMLKFAFDSEQEVELISILNAVVSNFQKYGNRNDDENKGKQ